MVSISKTTAEIEAYDQAVCSILTEEINDILKKHTTSSFKIHVVREVIKQ